MSVRAVVSRLCGPVGIVEDPSGSAQSRQYVTENWRGEEQVRESETKT
jgi:hypothetical protein